MGQAGANLDREHLIGLIERYIWARDSDARLTEPGWNEICTTREFVGFVADAILRLCPQSSAKANKRITHSF